MKTFFAVVGVLILVGLTGAFYLEWFDVKTNTVDADGRSEVKITAAVNQDKIAADLDKVSEEVKDTTSDAVAASKSAVDNATAEAVKGRVTNVDFEARTIGLVSETGAAMQLTVPKNIEIPAGLKEGDAIEANYKESENGVNRATDVDRPGDEPQGTASEVPPATP